MHYALMLMSCASRIRTIAIVTSGHHSMLRHQIYLYMKFTSANKNVDIKFSAQDVFLE